MRNSWRVNIFGCDGRSEEVHRSVVKQITSFSTVYEFSIASQKADFLWSPCVKCHKICKKVECCARRSTLSLASHSLDTYVFYTKLHAHARNAWNLSAAFCVLLQHAHEECLALVCARHDHDNLWSDIIHRALQHEPLGAGPRLGHKETSPGEVKAVDIRSP